MALATFTLFFVIALIVGVLAIDYAIACLGGDGSTISRVMEAINERNWFVAGGFSYGFAGLLVHLFLPRYADGESGWKPMGRAALFFLPVISLLATLAFSNPHAQPLYAICGSRRLWLIVEMIAFAIAGAAAAAILVPQHIPPRGN